ncbi:MAG: STAS domain-containing protein [Candidatus Acidiferrales bacterium]
MDLSIVTRPNGIATIVDVKGEVTLRNAPVLLKILMDLLKVKRTPRVIVNLTDVKYIDSAGVACLVEALKASRDLKLSFALFGLTSVAKEVFHLTRLITIFEVHATEEEALRGAQPASSGASA